MLPSPLPLSFTEPVSRLQRRPSRRKRSDMLVSGPRILGMPHTPMRRMGGLQAHSMAGTDFRPDGRT
jgi:hypothetical protein